MPVSPLWAAWSEPDPLRKCALTHALSALDAVFIPTAQLGSPGRPVAPVLVDPKTVPRRALHTLDGRAALIHAIAHIEFNAINLALDAALRFGSVMPPTFTADWIAVAKEEATHFRLLADHLRRRYQKAYGDFPAHAGLWEMAERTREDVLARLGLVPRVLEARGLDVTPGLIDKLEQAGDAEAADILRRILRDEVGHVALGNRWFAWLCETRGLEVDAQFALLQRQHRAPKLKPPFNVSARLAAGFSPQEIAQWMSASR